MLRAFCITLFIVLSLAGDDIERIERLTKEIAKLREVEVKERIVYKKEIQEVVKPNVALEQKLVQIANEKAKLIEQLHRLQNAHNTKLHGKKHEYPPHIKAKQSVKRKSNAKTYEAKKESIIYDAKEGKALFVLQRDAVITSDRKDGSWVQVTGMVISKRWRGVRGLSLWIKREDVTPRKKR